MSAQADTSRTARRNPSVKTCGFATYLNEGGFFAHGADESAPYNQNHQLSRWFALPLEGVVGGRACKRMERFANRMCCTAPVNRRTRLPLEGKLSSRRRDG